MPELLFEIGCEEIPAEAVHGAVAGLKKAAEERFAANRLQFSGLEVWTTPRRLTLVVRDLAEAQESKQEEITGPAWKVAFDAENNPTKAAEGFAAKNGAKVKDLIKVTTEKGEYIGIRRKLKAEKTVKLLPQILGELIRAVPFPKSMRWANHAETWVRPVHWLIALYGGKTIKLEFAAAKSGNKTFGHRFLAPKAFTVTSIDDYVAKLREAYVLVKQDERRETIVEQVKKVAAEKGGAPILDERLVDEVTSLVEWPVALRGEIEARFLEIPREVIVTSMRDHQRYFSVEGADKKLLPYFITISNMKTADPGIILAGNQRVLAARLSDAAFFVKEDLKKPLIDRLEALKTIVFQAKLGTSYEKYERFAKLAQAFNMILTAAGKGVDEQKLARAAALAKADLTTGMVGEFPELQGQIGSEYAAKQGEDPAVAQAIFEHYLPRGADDILPAGDLGALVAMADKLDTVVGCFGVGLIPTGTADPYALRRNALGILNILFAKQYPLLLDNMVDLALDLVEAKITRPRAEVRKDVLGFFQGRFENLLRSRGMAADEVDAVLARGFADVVDAFDRIGSLHKFRQDPAFEALATAFKRAANIVAKELGTQAPEALDPSRFEAEAERQLYAALQAKADQVKSLFAGRKYEEGLREVSTLREPVDTFFNDVMVVVPDPVVKANRLALLAQLRGLFESFADFTKLGG
jgi:glycyl-tRNA synthetase beta chain